MHPHALRVLSEPTYPIRFPIPLRALGPCEAPVCLTKQSSPTALCSFPWTNAPGSDLFHTPACCCCLLWSLPSCLPSNTQPHCRAPIQVPPSSPNLGIPCFCLLWWTVSFCKIILNFQKWDFTLCEKGPFFVSPHTSPYRSLLNMYCLSNSQGCLFQSYSVAVDLTDGFYFGAVGSKICILRAGKLKGFL